MACQWFRIDTTDQTGSAQGGKHPGMLYVESRGELMFWWNEDSNNSGTTTDTIKFRRMTTATRTLSTEYTVAGPATQKGYPHMCRLTSGRLVMVYGDGSAYAADPRGVVSNDHGATWASDTSLGLPGTALVAYPIAITTDGTNAWAFCQVPNGAAGVIWDVWVAKYTATSNTWGAWVKAYESGGTGGTPAQAGWTSGPWFQRRAIMVTDQIGMIAIPRADDAGTNLNKRITILRTTNAWAATSVIDIEHYLTADDGGEHNPVLAIAPDGRIVCSWTFQVSGVSNTYNAVVAYSADNGATWTVTGVPTAISDAQAAASFQFRPSIEPALYIHPDGRNFLTTLGRTAGDPASTLRFRKFYGNEDSIAGWTLNDCTFDWSADDLVHSSQEVCTADVTTDGIFMTTNAVGGGGTWHRIYVLFDESFTLGEEPEPPGPPPIERSSSGADENNIYIRKVLGPKSGGWSAHTKEVSCWMAWDEGDGETGREVPILVAGAEVWPTIQDPYLVGIINRIEAPDLYSDRHYYFGAGVQRRYDPLKVVIESKEYQLSGIHDKNVMRAIFLSYCRNSETPFNVELWVDDKIVNNYEFAGTSGSWVNKFRAVPTLGNVGSRAWLRITDESVDPLLIDSMEFIYMPKGWRGNRV